MAFQCETYSFNAKRLHWLGEMMHFQFRFEKALQATGVLLELAGGRMEYLRLLKLLYISDREMIAESLSPITGDRVVAMNHGPVLSQIYDLIKGQSAKSGEWLDYVSSVNYDEVSRQPIPRGKLSLDEIDKLKEVTDRYHGTNVWDICTETQSFPEWKEHFVEDTSSPIPWEDVLRAQGKGDRINLVGEEERLRREADSLFGP